jgi:hypothetical protein
MLLNISILLANINVDVTCDHALTLQQLTYCCYLHSAAWRHMLEQQYALCCAVFFLPLYFKE